MNWKEKLKIAAPLSRNRYVITAFIFILWVGIFDQNNFANRVSLALHNRELKRQKEHLLEETLTNREKLEDLKSSREALEKFAREQYMMKRADEDIFIIIE